ncbi:MAG: ribosomal protein S12 methylthiotransferase RimO [Lysobacterales bacterium]|nr:MAG: ribosomal protein S12 methylthiotransferase RimO [Xanthomonadales bacterium]
MSSRIGFVSLGCPKALVDSERILTRLRAEGYEVVGSYEEADAVVVNTCGFIDSAVEESLDAIGEALAENGKVIVTGCLGKREALIRERFPEVIAVTGPADFEAVMQAVHAALPPRHDPFLDLLPEAGIKLTPRHYAYLKIAEGCNNRCRFCIIPSLRGRLRSRPIAEVLREAEALVRAGVRELLIIAQDTAAYGADRRYLAEEWRGRARRCHVLDLAEALSELGVWVRLHYVYPYPHVDRLVEMMAEGRILPYLDVPLQHASPRILKAMRRPADREGMLARIEEWRRICPRITLRSSFIVGFPGETEEDFELLLDFLREAAIDRVGAFAYSPVDGAEANRLPDPVPEPVKQERLERLLSEQARISAERLRRRVGNRELVVVDRIEHGRALARSAAEAPEIDGQIRFRAPPGLKPGDRIEVRIVRRLGSHDLLAEPLREEAPR